MTDRKLQRVCKAFRDGLLDNGPSCLMCAVVSYPLSGFLAAIGIDTEVVKVEFDWGNHVFLKMRDGRVLDATADQFGHLKLPPVYIGAPREIHRSAHVKASEPEEKP